MSRHWSRVTLGHSANPLLTNHSLVFTDSFAVFCRRFPVSRSVSLFFFVSLSVRSATRYCLRDRFRDTRWPSDRFKSHESSREDSSVRWVTRRSTRVSDAKNISGRRGRWWQGKRSKLISSRRLLAGDDVRSGLKSGRKVLLGWRRDGHWAALGLTPTLGAHPHTSRGGVGVLKSPSGFRAVCTRRSRVYGWSAAPCACVTYVYIDRGVPAPRNGRGRRECWRAATRRLRPCGGSSSLPLWPSEPGSGDPAFPNCRH